MTDGIDSPGVEAGVAVAAGRGVDGAAGLRAVNLASISSNGVWPEDDERIAEVAAPGGGVGKPDPETPLSRKFQESGTTMKM